MTDSDLVCSSRGQIHHGLPTDWAFGLSDEVYGPRGLRGSLRRAAPTVIETRVQLVEVLQRLQRKPEAELLLAGCRDSARRLFVADAAIHAEIDRNAAG